MTRLRWLVALSVGAAAVVAVTVLLAATSKDDRGVPVGDPERNIWTGAAWDGDGGGDLSEAEARRFSQTPVYWFGPSIGQFKLTSMDGSDESSYITLIYGDCEPRGGRFEKSCAAPISIQIQPLCVLRPEQVTRSETRTLAGGALLNITNQGGMDGGSALVWTGQTAISLHLLPEGITIENALAELEGLAVVRHLPGEPLPPPDFSIC